MIEIDVCGKTLPLVVAVRKKLERRFLGGAKVRFDSDSTLLSRELGCAL